jgi:ribonuclease HII
MARRKHGSADQPELVGFRDLLTAPSRIAGVDEVGRGCLWGPVVAAAVILPESALEELAAAGVTDSKLIAAADRPRLAQQIRERAIAHSLGYASVREIDRLNILQASLLAMKRAILRLSVPPDLCLIDGNQRVPGLPFDQQTLIKGDQRCLAIAAASILAKVWRDELVCRLAVKYPAYDLANNKGYGTPAHRKALQELGPIAGHRRSFAPCRLAVSPEAPPRTLDLE